jgi:2-dehydropantoate 2-reductase
MRVLIVGAGAVGQVYGRHLALGGADVHYYVREKYADEIRRGLAFYPLNRSNPRRGPEREPIAADHVLTSMEALGRITWDQVYLCMSSAGLRGQWIADLAARVGKATIVSLQPNVDDRKYVLQHFPDEQVVSSMITLISYHAPLPGEEVPEPGMAYWFPPLAPAPASGAALRVDEVVRAFRAGGLPAKKDRDVPSKVAFPSTILMTLLTALESVGWAFPDLLSGKLLRLTREATREAIAITSRQLGRRGPIFLTALLRTVPLRVLLWLGRFAPLDLKTYLREHFTKVADQTRLAMKTYVEQGRSLGLSTVALEGLESRLKGPERSARHVD